MAFARERRTIYGLVISALGTTDRADPTSKRRSLHLIDGEDFRSLPLRRRLRRNRAPVEGKSAIMKIRVFVIACILFVALPVYAARADNIVVGVNAYGADVGQMADNGVKTLRISLLPGLPVDFVIQAYQHGIGSVVIVYPFVGSKVKPKGSWARVPFSELPPEEFVEGFQPMLDKLEAAGVRLTAMELDAEINTSGFDGDIPAPGSRRVLGLSDLNNPHDSEASIIAAGYRAYLKVMAALKDLRDHSKLNQHTPIISAGLAAVGPPSPKASGWNTGLAVSMSDTIEFMRQNGMDRLVDGYGLHLYPDADPHKSATARIASLEQTHFFGACTRAKPCWLTEWGIGNSDQSCPVNDAPRKQAIGSLRTAFQHFVSQGRLAAIIWYAWVGVPGEKTDMWAIFRCGVLTDAGKLALNPM